jgi:hypothetical protein
MQTCNNVVRPVCASYEKLNLLYQKMLAVLYPCTGNVMVEHMHGWRRCLVAIPARKLSLRALGM